MKIVFLVRSLTHGGAERQLVELAKGLHGRGHQVRVAVFYSGGSFVMALNEAGIPVVFLDKKRRWDVSRFLLKLTRLLRHEAPDVLHCYHTMPNVLGTTLKLFLPRTCIVWGVRSSDNERMDKDWLARACFRISCILSPFADQIIVNSKRGRDYHASQGYPESRMVVIQNGIDTLRFRPNAREREALRREWGVSNSERLIGMVGRLCPDKDHMTFLRAAALVLRRRPNGVRFVCVGDGLPDHAASLRHASIDCGLGAHVIWAGARDDVPAICNAIDVACLSSRSEGFPNVLAEAMGCGTPCVTTDVGDAAEIVGPYGIVVPVSKPESLADGVLRMLNQLEKGLIDHVALRQRIIQRFSLDALATETELVLSTLAGARCKRQGTRSSSAIKMEGMVRGEES